jgi:hypothetical protein
MAGQRSTFHHFHRAVIVAMSAMWMVQPAFDQIIGVIAVRHGFVAAPGTVLVTGRMALPGWLATFRVRSVHWEGVLVVVTFVRMMQVAVMQVIDVPVVFDRRVSATGLVLVLVVLVSVMIALHILSFPRRLLRLTLASICAQWGHNANRCLIAQQQCVPP